MVRTKIGKDTLPRHEWDRDAMLGAPERYSALADDLRPAGPRGT